MSEVRLSLSEAVRLAEVLERARGDYTPRILDVAGDPDGSVRLRLEDGDTPLWTVVSRGLTLGQAATILVPLTECVTGLGAAGIVHGSISLDAVRVDERGAPILGGFESASVIDPAERDRIRLDHAGFVHVARAVIAAVETADPDVPPALAGLLGDLDSIGRDDISAFGERLLEAVRPEPLMIGADARAAQPETPAAVAEVSRVRAPGSPDPSRSLPAPASALSATVLSASVLSVTVLPALRARLRRLGAVRPRFWVLGGGALTAVALGLVLLAVEPAPPSVVDEAAPANDTAAAAPSASAGDTASDIRADVPQDATRAPLTSRVADPAAALRELRPDVTAAAVVDDYGDVVLLSAETALGQLQVLLERTELGWRLRESLGEEAASELP